MKSLKFIILVVSLAVINTAVSGCIGKGQKQEGNKPTVQNEQQQNNDRPQEQVATTTEEINNENILKKVGEDKVIIDNRADINNIKVGDKIASMTVVSIMPYKSYNPLLEGNYKIKFNGKIEITGHYIYYGEGDMLENKICFDNLDNASKIKMPQLKGDDREIWFCFNNENFAKDAFQPKGSSGKATILIDNYTINMYGSEVWNTADLKLVKAINKNK